MPASDHHVPVPALQPGQVHLWQGTVGCGALADLDPSVLSPSEQARMASIANTDARALYAASHVALRHVLAAYDGRPARSLRFRTAEGGKPGLVDGHGLSFNLSHSGQMLLIAVADDCELGVDIEQQRGGHRSEAVARRFFAPEEYTALATCPAHLRSDYFTQIWALKEAYIKATGQGLAQPLQGFAVQCLEHHAELLRCDIGRPDDWTLITWTPTPGYKAALAAQRPALEVHHFDLAEADIPSPAGSLFRKPHSGRP
ncbi:4'-phosphopantetheinyl transferase superfamily protein [Phaeobacter inhibens]|nr:4'-phosphopantetheinyl transferase superfamily protein [Phaeobacter inhibens]